jgi:hypothetical protein
MAEDVTLYVWKIKPDDVGHASLQLGTTYVSYWPSDAAGKKDVKIGQTHESVFPRSYEVDKRLERKHCDARRVLRGLDTQRMKDAWAAFRRDPTRYNMVDHNCSTVIAVFLELGSGVKPSFVPGVAIDDHTSNLAQRIFLRIRFLSSTIKMWTPDALLRYADEIQARIP